MGHFENALEITLQYEGGFSDDPDDHGGATKFGITEPMARSYEYHGNMEDLPLRIAESIYRKEYWDNNRLEEISEYDFFLAAKLFDIAVNMGSMKDGLILQKSLNCLLDQGNELKKDGVIGSKTVMNLKKFSSLSEKKLIMKMLNSLQAVHYMNICENNESQKRFIRGWFERIK
jgi:lysozyme family protein